MQNTTRTDWGRRQPPIGGSNFELYAWFFMRVSGLFLVLRILMKIVHSSLIQDIPGTRTNMLMVITQQVTHPITP